MEGSGMGASSAASSTACLWDVFSGTTAANGLERPSVSTTARSNESVGLPLRLACSRRMSDGCSRRASGKSLEIGESLYQFAI